MSYFNNSSPNQVRPNSLPIETAPHTIFLGAGEAIGRRRRATCTAALSSPSYASYFVVLSLYLMVLVASNIVISSRFSVTTVLVLSSTYPPPLLAVKKSFPPSTLPEAISNRWRSPLLSLSIYHHHRSPRPPSTSCVRSSTLSPCVVDLLTIVVPSHFGIVKPRSYGSMFSMTNLQSFPSYAESHKPDLHISLVLGFISPVHRCEQMLCQSTHVSRLSSWPIRVTNSSHCPFPTLSSFLAGLHDTGYTPDIEAAPSHQGFYGAKLHRSNHCLLVTAGPIVQECCFARVAHDYVTAASLSHYAISSIDGSSQSRIGGLPDLLVTGTIVQECGLARFYNSITVASPSHYAVPSIDGSSQSQLYDLHTGFVARRSNHPEAFYLLSDVCSHMCWLNECDDCTLRSPSVTNCWAQHGNVEFQGLDPIKPSVLSSNFILSASLEVKLELEIHLVSSVSLVGFKADCACF
ncbi:hypothetical protein DY000_02034431 [Brassica cretica]|uniref:Uncharacterized protein n=1 Tax=Brassica cretica TaxID=69181 RepID=A0ABQ7DJF2_BRACR|nr:hypothetical protein DY000_02034431 [Brassica cretica]